ncbi:tetratricopeptide repeat protein, partial [bacterium]|nr:tetratricopeptide repeat protein [bacterium]
MSKKQILLLIVVIIGISAGFIAYKIHRQNVIAHGEDLLQRGEFQQVIDLLDENVQGASGSSSERILVAQAYYYQGNFKQALEVLDPLLRYGAENPKAALVSGWIQIEQGNLLTAQERFSLAKQQGHEAQAEAGLGAIALKESEGYKKTELSEAEMYLSGALNKNSTLPLAHYYLAELHLIRHEYEAAIDSAETLIGLAPKWAQSHLILGRAHLLAGNYEKAEAAFEASLEYGASEGDTKFYLAQSLYLQGRLRESLEFMHQLADMESDRSREAKENAAKIHLILGEQIQAESLLREAWETQSSPQTGIQLYSVLTRLNKQKEAETLINEMVENRPFLSEAQLELGHTLFEQNLLKPAYFAYQQVLDNDPQNFWAEYNLGCLALARQEPMQAPDYFQTAIQSAPDFYPAQINLAFSQFTQQQSEQTDLFLNELAEKFPNAPHIRLAQALKTFYSGQVEEAVRIIEQSLEDRQNTVRGNLLLGAMHMRLFQYEKALDCYENALQTQPDNHRAKLGKAHALYR